ncbi:MAG: DNA-directed RNA polymerase subunit beta [Meiothermus sp.]|uniref:DNA-directed RNA polymerase subunit beta n=1 Tax=Meiothermus sp. TaxID=1955249 RepID=UPI0025DB6256|nr:DNA-directed RNA polymerase subunit beta [Meiothermus sp.]MCS7058542.1 DNA-directed RNA polymerase subunit beta [Meiothermus sp.]MCS7195446.1 DNA-directed RNA polymerase subunit beta [Meiothermus sp.]MDW8091073.1 DNA-directed RNA polymerase subunit beta [Meiothermus sp.]
MKIERYGKIKEVIPLPPLTEIQVESFKKALQADIPPSKRENVGLQAAFRETFPIEEGEKGRGLVLDFIEYRIGEPPFSQDECREKDLTYQAPLYARLQLIHRDTGLIKEDEVFLGDLPLMTEDGSFIVNGADRVIVSQIHRSPGVYFTPDQTRPGRYVASVIPLPKRGPWIDLEFEQSGIVVMKVNKKKFPLALLLRVLGYTAEGLNQELGRYTELLPGILEAQYRGARVLEMSPEEALLKLFTELRPGDPPKRDKAITYLHSLLSDPRRYDLGEAGRYKTQQKLGIQLTGRMLIRFEEGEFKDEGLLPVLKYLFALQSGEPGFEPDDIDHLGNRRIRTVGELLADQFRVGLSRLARGVRERMLLGSPESATPAKLVNNRPLVAAIREFFGRSQLSQFKDQTNPLSELRHKRRISALGPGGLTRERAGFDVRDVHRTHYGRICPIETPEGANIGLISSLASYGRINDLGFILTPYRRVVQGRVTDEVVYMTATEEDRYVIAQANTPLTPEGYFDTQQVVARKRGEPMVVRPEEVEYMDVSPKQIFSVNTNLIPFLEHDDANRALMGSNMQAQAVPLLRAQSPVVMTGIEERVVRDSLTSIYAEADGVVEYVDSTRIVLRGDDKAVYEYPLRRFIRSNQGTALDQRPRVSKGQRVSKGELLADGPAAEEGMLALGQNVLVAIMPFDGYNYEDAIVISEDLLRRDFYTSVHIERYEIEARDTKLGPERITRDIPNLSEAALRDLDEDGVVRIGAEVKAGDILVGRTSFKGETEPTPEERLLRSIFGEKAKDVKDTSLRVPPGEGGIVVRTLRLRRGDPGVELKPGVREVVRVYVAQKRKLQVGDKLANRHGNKGVVAKILPPEDMPHMPDGTPVDIVLNPLGVPSRMNLGQILETHLGLAGYELGLKFITPVFDGISEEQIKEMLGQAFDKKWEARLKAGFGIDNREREVLARAAKLGLVDGDRSLVEQLRQVFQQGKSVLYDGRTGEPIEAPIVVGVMYIMKLYHMVEDKMHARSTGPYSLITQQPLGGKAQFGGQRFGEMEVWALEAYGAAHTLQEILTIKSDDIEGRNAAYEAVVKGEDVPEASVPESFRVLVKELQSLGLNVETYDENGKTLDIFEGLASRR